MKMPRNIGPVHFIGIGGIGMSGIAEVLMNLGYRVQGSDQADGANIQRLREKGIEPELAAKSAAMTAEQELEAAQTLVRKKRLGVDPERRQKDFAVLMRAGFRIDVAKRALQARYS